MERHNSNQFSGAFQNQIQRSLADLRQSVLYKENSGDTAISQNPTHAIGSKKDGNGLWIVSSEREREIKNAVGLIYKRQDLPTLADELKICKKEVLALDKPNAPKMTPVYVFNFDDEIRKKKELSVKLSYSGLDLDGQEILSLYVAYIKETVYLKAASDGTTLFSPAKVPTDTSKEAYLPFKQAIKSKARFGFYKITLEYLNDIHIAHTKFKNLVNKVKGMYIYAIACYYVFLEQHGFFPLVDQMIECSQHEQPQLKIPFIKLSGKQAFANDKDDANQLSDVNDGDKICCKLSSVITVMNTFQCLEKQHHMVRVVLEVLIKNAYESMPFTREFQAYYCKECQRIFMYTSEYDKIRKYAVDSQYQVFNWFDVDGSLSERKRIITSSWADESILKVAGYEVNRDSVLSQQQRLDILIALNRRGISYHSIVSYLNTFITVLGSAASRDMTQAVQRWKSDLDAVEKMYTAKVIR